MTKLTPARKALLHKLVDAGGAVEWHMLSPVERNVAVSAENAGRLCWRGAWGNSQFKNVYITDAGRAALQNEVK